MVEKLRPQDLLVYLGSDKFAMLLPEATAVDAIKVAERLRKILAMSTLHTGASIGASADAKQEIQITISVGIAAMQPGDVLDTLFSLSHMALYQAKAGGRDQVKLAPVAAPA